MLRTNFDDVAFSKVFDSAIVMIFYSRLNPWFNFPGMKACCIPVIRPIPTTCVKGALAGHCINFLAKQPTKSYQCLKTFQNAKVNTLLDNASKMKDALEPVT